MKRQSFSNPLLYSHTCEALLLTCMDFRFHETTVKFMRETLGIKKFDLLTVPGGAKALAEQNERGKYIEDTIALSRQLHQIEKVVLVNHANCGAYAIQNAEEELKRQSEDLQKAAEILKKTFPSVSIIPYFAQTRTGVVHYIQPISTAPIKQEGVQISDEKRHTRSNHRGR